MPEHDSPGRDVRPVCDHCSEESVTISLPEKVVGLWFPIVNEMVANLIGIVRHDAAHIPRNVTDIQTSQTLVRTSQAPALEKLAPHGATEVVGDWMRQRELSCAHLETSAGAL